MGGALGSKQALAGQLFDAPLLTCLRQQGVAWPESPAGLLHLRCACSGTQVWLVLPVRRLRQESCHEGQPFTLAFQGSSAIHSALYESGHDYCDWLRHASLAWQRVSA